MTSHRLARRILSMQTDVGAKERQAVVTAVHAGPPKTVDLTLGGDEILGCRYLASYTPTVGDVVRVLQDGPDLTVLGDLA